MAAKPGQSAQTPESVPAQPCRYWPGEQLLASHVTLVPGSLPSQPTL